MIRFSRKTKTRYSRMRGITLLELLIVVVIVGILAAVAYPSYRAQIIKTNRADGKAMLMELSQQLERCYTRFSEYNNGACNATFPSTSADGHYIVEDPVRNRVAYTLEATPQAGQADDAECGVLTLMSTGVGGSLGVAGTDANDCW